MNKPLRLFGLIAVSAILLGGPRQASADLALSFDQSTYTIPGVGNTAAVQVFVSQTPGGPQVGPGNELLTAGIELSFATAGAAIVASGSDVTPGPAWDSSSVGIMPSGSNTLVDLGLTSLAGISDLSVPVLLGTFVFTGQSPGVTSISVATLGPGPSFITVNGDVLDPPNPAGARILVQGVPEPAGIVLSGIGLLLLGAARVGRKFAGPRMLPRAG